LRRKLAALAVLATAVAGCGLGAGSSSSGVALTVSDGFGKKVLVLKDDASTKGQDTVLRFLSRNAKVTTRFGGGFVQSVDGLAGKTGASQVDWFYFVNGAEGSKGAGSVRVHAGDSIWWDRHDWSAAMDVPAVVGSFPEPFVSGNEGRKLPVRLVCLGDGADEACDEVETRLRDAGVTDTARSVLEQSAGREVLRVLVGPWSQLRRDTAARKLEGGPQQSGVFARPSEAGDKIDLLDDAGRVDRTLGAGGGLLAATRIEAQQPTWLVTGVDGTGVAAAAAALTEDELQDRFAIGIEQGRTVPLPVTEAGEEP
jgi:hypothetical protein